MSGEWNWGYDFHKHTKALIRIAIPSEKANMKLRAESSTNKPEVENEVENEVEYLIQIWLFTI